ncbi:hypothetical protein RCO48_26200 [Peribacillus frigoritolerans]|nr:hypothetical protein [Peribacillus frigoritolerans]
MSHIFLMQLQCRQSRIFQPVFRDEEEEELYAPFSAESKRVSEANEEEEEEPIYLSDQHNAPVF